jgi:hypothetical protein
MKKIILFVSFILLLIASLIACSATRYNANPDLSKKVVGSKSEMLDPVIPQSFEDVVAYASDVIIGTVIDNGALGAFSISGIKEIDQAYADATGLSSIACTLTSIKVEKVIMGDIDADSTITYFQVGKPGSDDCQTKVKMGEYILIMLRPSDTKNVYFAGNGEESVFYINESNKLTSQADLLLCARYDGTPLDTILEDIKSTNHFKKVQESVRP